MSKIENKVNKKEKKRISLAKTVKIKKRTQKYNSRRFSIDSLAPNSNSILKKSTLEMSLSNDEINKNKRSIISNKSNESKNKNIFLENYIKYIPKNEIKKLLYEEELNNLEYIHAIELDERSFFSYYFSLIRQKQLIIFTFFVINDYNIYSMKISLLLCSFSIYLITNTIFFNDENMHEIYVYDGKYNFIYQLPIILYSTIISVIFNNILKILSLSQRNILKFKQINETNDMIRKMLQGLKVFKIKIILFNIIGLIILIFGWYYLTLFCAVYTNTQIHLLKDSFSSFGLSLIYPFGLNLIPSIFRIIALKSKKMNKKCLYNFSQLTALF